MDPRPLKYVAPTSTEESLPYAPEPVVIYDLPSGGGGGGGAVNSVNGKTGTVVLNSADVGAAKESEVAEFAVIVQNALTDLGTDLDTKASTAYVNDQLATKASATDLDNVFGIATNAQTLATDAVPKTRTISGKPLSANITLDKVDVGLSNVDNVAAANLPVSTAQQTALNLKANLASPTFTGTVGGITKAMVGLANADNTSDLNKPISTATQTALDAKVPTSRTVAGKALSADVTLVKGDVGLGNVDNTSDAAKPVSTATQTALNAKINTSQIISAMSTPGIAQMEIIPKNGVVVSPSAYMVVIEAEA